MNNLRSPMKAGKEVSISGSKVVNSTLMQNGKHLPSVNSFASALESVTFLSDEEEEEEEDEYEEEEEVEEEEDANEVRLLKLFLLNGWDLH